MLKIGLFETKDSARAKENRGTSKKTGATFQTELAGAIESSHERDLEGMMSDLADQERRFLDRQDLMELANYKKLVQKILSLIADDAFQSQSLKRRKRNFADFQIVKKIDQKLLDLSRKISSGNRAFDLFRDLEEIRGLLLDMVK